MCLFAEDNDDDYDSDNNDNDDVEDDDNNSGNNEIDINGNDNHVVSSKFNKINSIHKLSKMFFNNELDSEVTTPTTTSSSTITTSSSENSNGDNIVDNDNGDVAATTSSSAAADDDDKLSISHHYIYRKRCQMEDDWGTIGLNCTNDDIIEERVVVIGFLVNWMKAFIHIRSEFFQF